MVGMGTLLEKCYTTASAMLHKNNAVDMLHKHIFLIFKACFTQFILAKMPCFTSPLK